MGQEYASTVVGAEGARSAVHSRLLLVLASLSTTTLQEPQVAKPLPPAHRHRVRRPQRVEHSHAHRPSAFTRTLLDRLQRHLHRRARVTPLEQHSKRQLLPLVVRALFIPSLRHRVDVRPERRQRVIERVTRGGHVEAQVRRRAVELRRRRRRGDLDRLRELPVNRLPRRVHQRLSGVDVGGRRAEGASRGSRVRTGPHARRGGRVRRERRAEGGGGGLDVARVQRFERRIHDSLHVHSSSSSSRPCFTAHRVVAGGSLCLRGAHGRHVHRAVHERREFIVR